MSLPLAVKNSRNNIRNHPDRKASIDLRLPGRLSSTFEKPVGVTLFGAVGLEEGEDILGDVFHHPRGECRVLQMRNVLCFYHLVFLQENHTGKNNKDILIPLFQ